MKKYMITFFGGNMALRYSNLDKVDKEAQEKHRAAWGKWISELVKAGHLETGHRWNQTEDGSMGMESGNIIFQIPQKADLLS